MSTALPAPPPIASELGVPLSVLDLATVGEGATDAAALHRSVVAVERLHAAVPEGVVPDDTVSLAALAEFPWILAGPRSHFGRAVRAECHAHGFEPRIAHTVEEQFTALAMIAGGLGVTLVSDLGLTLLPPGVDVVPLEEPVLRTLSVAHRASSTPRPSIDLFVEAARTAAAEQGLGAAT